MLSPHYLTSTFWHNCTLLGCQPSSHNLVVLSSNFISRRIQYDAFHTNKISTISQMYSSGTPCHIRFVASIVMDRLSGCGFRINSNKFHQHHGLWYRVDWHHQSTAHCGKWYHCHILKQIMNSCGLTIRQNANSIKTEDFDNSFNTDYCSTKLQSGLTNASFNIIQNKSILITRISLRVRSQSHQCRDHSGNGLSQWKEALLCNVFFNWPSPYPE